MVRVTKDAVTVVADALMSFGYCIGHDDGSGKPQHVPSACAVLESILKGETLRLEIPQPGVDALVDFLRESGVEVVSQMQEGGET